MYFLVVILNKTKLDIQIQPVQVSSEDCLHLTEQEMDPGVRIAFDERFEVQKMGIKSTLDACRKTFFYLKSKPDECLLLWKS